MVRHAKPGVFLALLCAGCGGADHVASFFDAKGRTEISIELRTAHPTLAEYERTLIVRHKGRRMGSFQLAMDTGGHGAANLYACHGEAFMVVSYGESVVIDETSGAIHPGACAGAQTYMGVFDGGGSKPWRFVPAAEMPERQLVMRGG